MGFARKTNIVSFYVEKATTQVFCKNVAKFFPHLRLQDKVPRDREVEAVTVPLLLPTATMEVESAAGKPAGASSAQVNQPQHTKATRPEAQHSSPLRVPGIVELLDLPLQKP